MNRNRVISVFVFATLFVIALVVINYAYATADLPASGIEDRARQADAARWQAMGEYYTKQQASVSNFALKRSWDAYAARLQGQADFYLQAKLRARQADAARWQAMGEYYTKQRASVSNFALKRSWDAYAARLQGQADFYLKAKLRARQADAARWQAMGEYYTKLQK